MFLHQTRHTNSMDQSFCLYFSRQMPFIAQSRGGRYPNNKPLRSDCLLLCLRLGCDDMSRFKWIVTRDLCRDDVTQHDNYHVPLTITWQLPYLSLKLHIHPSPPNAQQDPLFLVQLKNKGSVFWCSTIVHCISLKYFPCLWQYDI